MKKRKLKILINVTTGVLCAAIFAVLFAMLVTAYSDDVFKIILSTAIGFAVILFLNVLLHELGHLVFGLIAGLKFHSIKILWFYIGRGTGGNVKFKLTALNGELGETELVPKSAKNVATKYVVSAAGGLVGTALCIVLSYFISVFTDSLILYAGLGITLPLTLYIFIINFLPIFDGNDGWLVYTKLAGGEECEIMNSAYKATAMLYDGVEPCELDSSLLVKCNDYGDFSVKIRYLRYLAYFSRDEERAAKELYAISDLSLLGGGMDDVYKELFFIAIILKDKRYIEANRESVIGLLEKQVTPQDFRIHAALRIYDGDTDWAKLVIESGIKFCDTYFVKGIATSEKKYLENMLNGL